MTQKSTHLSILTPVGVFYEADVAMVTVNTISGQMGLLPEISQIISFLKAAPIKIKELGQAEPKILYLSGGIVYADFDKIRIISDNICETEEEFKSIDDIRHETSTFVGEEIQLKKNIKDTSSN